MTELNTLLTSEDYREHAEFWTRSLGLIEEDFRLRQNWQSYVMSSDGAPFVVDFELDEVAARVVNELGRGKDTGVFVIVLGALFHVLRIYTGAETVFADSPALITGGDELGTCVPLIFEHRPELTVRAYLDRVRDLVAQSYTYQDFPIRQLAEGPLKRNLPTTNVLVHMQGIHEPITADESMAGYDGVISIHRTDQRLSVRIEGKTSVSSTQFVGNLGRHLHNAIAGFADLDAVIGTISVIDEEERHKLLESLAWTRGEVPEAETVLELFTKRVAAAPERIAIATNELELTYGELDDKSNRIAQFLISEYGVRSGDVVGVLSLRSELWVTAMLGIMKAGAVYLPLDPEYPQERIRFMVADAGAKALLIHSDCFSILAELEEVPIFALDLQLETIEAVPQLSHRASGEGAAYIIYTSGSTGQPKGVVLEHRGLVNMAVHHVECFGFDHTDRLTQFYSPCFDASILEVFVTLLAGATLVMVPPEVIKDPQRFSTYIAVNGVTTLNAPPIYLDALDWDNLPQVRRVISAGDQAKAETARKLAQSRTYNNSYGPTEATVCATNYEVNPRVQFGSRVPIGRPLRNMAIYLLDDELNLVPEGVIGEICISGIGVARGYLNRDDLTAKTFSAKPFLPNERLYRTGDLGVWLPDGNLELTGRKDTQVKVRGFRIELGEIESHLLRFREVHEAIVLVSEERPGDKRLIAFVSPAGETSGEVLRERLKAKLPPYMIPSSIVLLDKMPVNQNGKIDRKALASTTLARVGSSGYAPPVNALQESLVRIWSEVLGRENIGIHDNFFELGGDSILVIQAVSSAHQAGIKLSAQQVFEYQTIAAVSDLAVDARSSYAEQGVLTGPVPLTPIQQWFFERPLKSRHHYNQSVMLETPADVAPEVFEQALSLLIQHHDGLRLRFPESDGIREQMYAESETNSPFAVTDLSGLLSSEQDAVIKAESARLQGSLDLSMGPILRMQLFKRGDGQPSRLLLIIHHLAVDGVSWRILFEDFLEACRALQTGDAANFPPKTSSFRDWAVRLQELSNRNSWNKEYWLNKARWEVPRIPLDYAGGFENNLVDSQSAVRVDLSEDETSNLLQEAPKAFNTQINDILLTALLLVVQEWTGEGRLLVDLEGHGREELFEDVDVSRTTGWFTNVYPLFLETEAGASLTDTLKSVKEQIRAVPLHGVEYGMARWLGSDRDYVEKLESQPRPEIVFNYLGQIDRVVSAGGDWKLMADWDSPEHAPNDPRSHVLEIEGIVQGKRLILTWKFSNNLHSHTTIDRIANRYAEILRSLIEHCANLEAGSFTPSDFPAARLDQETLDALMEQIRG